MRKYILILFLLISISSVISSFEKDMKYHGEPCYYWPIYTSWAIASYFEPENFGVNSDFKIKTIGQMGYDSNGSAVIYIFLSETKNHPNCTPPEFSNKKYGPYSGHINNSYPNYDDLDIYNLNWYINKKEIDEQINKRFWVIYYMQTIPTPSPVSDESTAAKNSCEYDSGYWTTTISGYFPCWCMHCVIVYWGSDIENTSLGVVKALFK